MVSVAVLELAWPVLNLPGHSHLRVIMPKVSVRLPVIAEQTDGPVPG